MKKTIFAVAIILILLGLYGMGTYNNLVSLREDVNGSWAQVENVYQRRADLIPNLVATVKGYAAQEKDVLIGVTEARAKVGQVTLKPGDLNNAAKLAQFQSAQDGLGSALSRLMVVVEKYPELKSNENFLALQSQLEGTENRIAVERQRFNELTQRFNQTIVRVPTNLIAKIAGLQKLAYFQAKAGAENVPTVQF